MNWNQNSECIKTKNSKCPCHKKKKKMQAILHIHFGFKYICTHTTCSPKFDNSMIEMEGSLSLPSLLANSPIPKPYCQAEVIGCMGQLFFKKHTQSKYIFHSRSRC